MSRKSILLTLLALLIILTAVAPAGAASKESTLELSTASDERSFTLTVKGVDLNDVYAYELVLDYDQSYLKLVSAKSEWSGYTVDPIIEQNSVRLAHTKIGNVKGISGDSDIASFTFQRIRAGETAITLKEVQLVDSKLEMITLKPALLATVDHSVLPKFDDIAGHWAEDNIIDAAALGFVNGYNDHTFRPNTLVDRAAFTTMLARALNLKGGSELAFTDKDEIPAWALPHVKAAIENNLINGYSDNTFRADRNITRSEMATMVVRAADLQPKGKTSFADSAQIPAWAEPYIAAAVDEGLMQGRGGNKFAPNEYASRAEAVTLILNLLKKLDSPN